MKLADQHVSDRRLTEFIEWAESRNFPTPGIRRLMEDMVNATLELKMRRAEDRQREANKACRIIDRILARYGI